MSRRDTTPRALSSQGVAFLANDCSGTTSDIMAILALARLVSQVYYCLCKLMIPIDCWLRGRGIPSGAQNPSQNPKRKAIGNPTLSQKARKEWGTHLLFFELIFRERIGERLKVGFLNHPLVVVAEKFLQPIGVHSVLAGHIRDGVRRNRRDLPVPQKLQNAAHAPLSRNSQQFGVRQFDTLRKGQRIATSRDVQDGQPLCFRFPP